MGDLVGNAGVAKSIQPPMGSPSVHLDALRGLAAFSVFLGHWRDAFFVNYPELGRHSLLTTVAYLVSGLGYQWVIVFFVMSGYLVGGSVLRLVGDGRWSWRTYLLSRLTRLYIVLIPALLLGGVIDWVGMHIPGTDAVYSGRSGMYSLRIDVHQTLTPEVLAANTLFLQTIVLPGTEGRRPQTFGSNGPLWSLANEFWYYMAFPLLVLLLVGHRSRNEAAGEQRRGVRGWGSRAVCGVSLVAWGWFVGPGIALLWVPWLMGVTIPYWPRFPQLGSWMRGLAIIVALALLGGALLLGKLEHNPGSSLLLGGAVTVLIWVTVHCATAPVPAMYARVAQRAARSSYTLYLVHMPLLIFLKALLAMPRVQPGWYVCLKGLVVIAVVLVYAQLVYEVFEKHTDRLRRWLRPYVMGQHAA